jgi:hypothetical protein
MNGFKGMRHGMTEGGKKKLRKVAVAEWGVMAVQNLRGFQIRKLLDSCGLRILKRGRDEARIGGFWTLGRSRDAKDLVDFWGFATG